jgi:hypothetical protein
MAPTSQLSSEGGGGGSADERMTAEREETKYLVPPGRWELLAAEMSRRLPGHRFTGEGANRLPDPHHYVTTVYFDTPSRSLFRAAAAAPDDNVKIRAKEYYDLHPSLAELATDPAQIVRYQPWVWFELKRRDGTRTAKRRFRLPKRDVAQFFAEGRVTPEAMELAQGTDGQGEGLRDVVDTCRAFGEPLSAVCLVNYRRLSWQSDEAELRVTFDRGLASFAPPADLWARRHALVRATLGPAAGQEASGVLEIKRRGALPGWLSECLAKLDVQPVPFSKFLTAFRAVEGHG